MVLKKPVIAPSVILAIVLAILIAALSAAGPVLAAPARAARTGLEQVVLVRAAAAPVIDGKLDDPIWSRAVKFDSWKTFKPDIDKDPSQKTVAYLAYDADNLYFAVRCFDTEPQKVKVAMSKRDGIDADDIVGFILDTFDDRQSGFTFMLNALGIQEDGMMNVQGNVDTGFDMVWYSKGQVDDQGWTVEARVPLQSLRFPNKKTLTMRALFFRFFIRTSEQATSPPINPNSGSILGQSQPIELSGLHYERVIEILPATTYRVVHDAQEGRMVKTDETKLENIPSLTAKLGLTSDLVFDGAYNPDFSQVEADAGQVDINLRYANYYEEKRPFFLERQDLWQFGGMMEDSPLISLVYTRTIIDPIYGFKLTGKVSRRDTLAAIYARDNLPGDGVDVHPDFTIARYRHSIKDDGYIGAFYTGREAGSVFNRVGGFDGRFRLSQVSVLSFHAFGALTRPPGEEGVTPETNKDHALSVLYEYSTRKWLVNLGYQDVSRNFQVDTGFLTRTGVRRIGAFAMYQIYPKSSFIQKIEPFYWSYHLYDTIYDMWETMNFFVLRFYLPRSTQVRFEGILGNEVYLGQRFSWNGFGLRTETQILKRLFVNAYLRRWGKVYYDDPVAPYQGYGISSQTGVRYQPIDKLDFSLNLTYSNFYRSSDREKIYDYTILRNRNTFQVNKYLFVRAIFEYNIYYKRLTADGLVSFTYIPGTVFYVGYGTALDRTEWNGAEYVRSDRFNEKRRGFFFKISYLWRI
jgi:hypothetical protein